MAEKRVLVEGVDFDPDWIKAVGWDIRDNNEEPVTTLNSLLTYLNVQDGDEDQQVNVLRDFTKLTAWQAAPEPLKSQVESIIAQNGSYDK